MRSSALRDIDKHNYQPVKSFGVWSVGEVQGAMKGQTKYIDCSESR